MINSISAKELLAKGSGLFKKNFWNLFLIHLIIVICVIALLAIFFGVVYLSIETVNPYNNSLPIFTLSVLIIFALAFVLLTPVLVAGYSYIYIKIARGEKVSLGALFHGFSNFWSIWLTQYFKMVLIYAGSLLFLIPSFLILIPVYFYPIYNTYIRYGMYNFENYFFNSSYFYIGLIIFPIIIAAITIYWVLKFMLTTYVAIDKKTSASEALFFGSEIVKGYKWKMFLALLLPYFLSFITGIIIGILDNSDTINLYDFLVMFLSIFIFTPWLNCIIAEIYIRLSKNFDNTSAKELFPSRKSERKSALDIIEEREKFNDNIDNTLVDKAEENKQKNRDNNNLDNTKVENIEDRSEDRKDNSNEANKNNDQKADISMEKKEINEELEEEK
ncbi:MAG: DUF975 family protein [Halanaerobiales bacterium]